MSTSTAGYLGVLLAALRTAPVLPSEITQLVALRGSDEELEALASRSQLDSAALALLVERALVPPSDPTLSPGGGLRALLVRRADLPRDLLELLLGETPSTELLLELVGRAELLDLVLAHLRAPARPPVETARLVGALLLRAPLPPARTHELLLLALELLAEASPDSSASAELLAAISNSHALRARALESLLVLVDHPHAQLATAAFAELAFRDAGGAWPGVCLDDAPPPAPELLLPTLANALISTHLLVPLRRPTPLPEVWWAAASALLPHALEHQLESINHALSARAAEAHPTRSHRARVRALVGAEPSLEHVLVRASASEDSDELARLSALSSLNSEAALALAANPHLPAPTAIALIRTHLAGGGELTQPPRTGSLLSHAAAERAARLVPLVLKRSDPEFSKELFNTFPLLLAALPAHLGPRRARELLITHLSCVLPVALEQPFRSSVVADRAVLVRLLEGRFDDVPVGLLLALAPLDGDLSAWIASELAPLGSSLEQNSAAAWVLLDQILGSFSGTLGELIEVVRAALGASRTGL